MSTKADLVLHPQEVREITLDKDSLVQNKNGTMGVMVDGFYLAMSATKTFPAGNYSIHNLANQYAYVSITEEGIEPAPEIQTLSFKPVILATDITANEPSSLRMYYDETKMGVTSGGESPQEFSTTTQVSGRSCPIAPYYQLIKDVWIQDWTWNFNPWVDGGCMATFNFASARYLGSGIMNEDVVGTSQTFFLGCQAETSGEWYQPIHNTYLVEPGLDGWERWSYQIKIPPLADNHVRFFLTSEDGEAYLAWYIRNLEPDVVYTFSIFNKRRTTLSSLRLFTLVNVTNTPQAAPPTDQDHYGGLTYTINCAGNYNSAKVVCSDGTETIYDNITLPFEVPAELGFKWPMTLLQYIEMSKKV